MEKTECIRYPLMEQIAVQVRWHTHSDTYRLLNAGVHSSVTQHVSR